MQAGPGRQHSTHLVQQGAAEPKNTLFHTELEIWSVACWGDSHGVGRGTPVPGGWNGGDWAGCRIMAGPGLLPCHIPAGSSCGSPALSAGRGGSAGAALPPQPSLPAPAQGRARSQAGGTGRAQREQGPGCARSSTAENSGAREARDGAAAISHCQAGASGTQTRDWPGRTRSSSHHTPQPRGGVGVPSTQWPLLHQQPLWGPHRCEGPASAGTVEWGEPCHGTELSHHPPASPPPLRTHK